MPPRYVEGRVLMDAKRLARALARLARQIVARHPDPRELVLVGIRTRGVPLARRLARLLEARAGAPVPVGALDITLYRDDFSSVATQPILKGTDIRFSIDGRSVVLTDDVLFTGRTVRAALDELIDFGRPARIELAVVVDRGHRELPIRADYVGQAVTTRRDDVVQVELAEQDGADRVVLLERSSRAGAKRAAARRTAKRRGGRRAK